MRFVDRIEVKQNLIITARERGKIIARREGHNIWTDVGSSYLAELIAFSNPQTQTTYRDDRIKYMGVGIGGTAQKAKTFSDIWPLGDIDAPEGGSGAYTGTNEQTDTDATVSIIERPVKLSGVFAPYDEPDPNDIWIGIVGIPDLSLPNQVTFTRVFTQAEINFNVLVSVPLSEIGLFTSAADPNSYTNEMVAYDTFDTISKTAAINLEVVWTIHF